MSVPQIIFGIVMIGIGLFFAKMQIKSHRNGVKDTFGCNSNCRSINQAFRWNAKLLR